MKSLLTFCLSALVVPCLLAQSLVGVESVEYDPINNRYLASSDNNSIISIAPNGALSYFGSGTQASHGMEVFDGRIFVIDGSNIRCFDLTTETMLFSQPIAGAVFLNGMTSNGTDSIWFTDFTGKDIYAMNVDQPQNYTMVVQNIQEQPNGIAYDGDNNRCVFVTWGTGKVKAMNLNTYAVSNIIANTGLSNIDGIDRNGAGEWFISAWTPASIRKYNSDFSAVVENLNVPGISSPADICYAPETDTLAIPGANQVIFVGFESTSVGIDEELFETHRIYYSNGYPVVQFELSTAQEVSFDILDMGGRVVFNAMQGPQSQGKQTVVLSSVGLYSGNYLCRVNSKEVSFTERIIIP